MKQEITKIIIDVRMRLNYVATYLYGFELLCGGNTLKYSIIDDVPYTCEQDFSRGCALLLVLKSGVVKRLFIDSHDSNLIHEGLYSWADVYAKVNARLEDTKKEKMLVIGPNFGVQIWNPFKTMLIGVFNYIKCKESGNYPISVKTYLVNYYAYSFVRRQYFEQYYIPQCEEEKNYVFSLNTLWYDEQTYSTTNRYRGAFVNACKRIYPHFEGGFFYIPSASVEKQFPQYREYLDKYKGLLFTKRIGMREYLNKTWRSAIVFNTPSVLGCHGWKLGEYLAMGKAIISTPLNNMMPGEFVAGKHYLEVKNEEQIEEAVVCLKNDDNLRVELKKNAKQYFDEFLAPEAVVSRIIRKCFESC